MMQLRRVLLSFFLFALPLTAEAQTRPTQPIPEGDREGFMWLVRPSALPFSLFFPERALRQNVVGRVMLECRTRVDQRLDCEAVEETPTGWGFGEAAIGVSRSFRALPAMRNGQLIGGSFARVPINFQMGTRSDDPRGSDLDLPEWEAAPNSEAVRAAWTEGAAHPNVRGRAVLSCTVAPDRSLNCQPSNESRQGLGLGRAAMALSSQFRVSTHDADFIQRHRFTPFLMPVNFGFDAAHEPLNLVTAGGAPVLFPEPPAAVVQAAFPPGARDAGISGNAVVTCTLEESGDANCVVTSEAPAGYGFGEAAMRLAQGAFGVWVDLESLLPGDEVQFPVPFELSSADQSR